MESEFAKKYTNANIAQDASRYDSELFLQLQKIIAKVLPSSELAHALLTVSLCAQGRGDCVARLFQDVIKDKSDAEVRTTFTAIREAVTLVVPFVGLPNCMPACFGLVNELKTRGIQDVPGPRRDDLRSCDYTSKGHETVSTIYRGVGNAEVREMTQQYFPDMSYYGRTTIFGFLLGSSPIFELKDAEMLVAASIIALGATRQARSHIKCCLVVGNSQDAVAAVVEAVQQITAWNKGPLLGPFDVGQLAQEIEA